MLEVIKLTLSSIVQVISFTYVVHSLSERKTNYKNKKNIITLMILVISLIILWKYSYNAYKPIIAYGLITFGYKFMLNITYQQSSIINFINIFLHAISELIITAIIIGVLQINPTIIEKYLSGTPILGIIAFFVVVAMVKLFGKHLIKITKLLEKELVFNVVYLTGIIGVSLFLSLNIHKWNNDSEFIISVITIILFIILILFLLREKIKESKASKKFDELFEQSETIKTLLNRYKKYNHENKNQLIVIRENSKGNKKVIEYIDSILNENMGHEDKWINELSYITDPGISGFLSVKINEMIDNGIKVSLIISPKVKKYKFEKIKSKEYKEICRILGVYLDNAHEASSGTKKKEVTIEILIDDNRLLIIISNSFKGKIELDKLDKEGYTTKGKNHGVGLSLVSDIIKSNNHLEQKREIIKDYYFQYLYIKN